MKHRLGGSLGRFIQSLAEIIKIFWFFAGKPEVGNQLLTMAGSPHGHGT